MTSSEPTFFTYLFSVKGHHVGPEGWAQPWFVQNVAQDVSVGVSETHGFTSEWYRKAQSGWVLRRIEVDNHIPWILEQNLVAKTWISRRSRVKATRQYRYTDWDTGQPAGGACAEWVYVDARTGKPMPIPEIFDRRYPVHPEETVSPLRPPDEKPVRVGDVSFSVRYSDLDMNNHANNVAAIRWMTDALHELGHHGRVLRWSIEFRLPAPLGERLLVEVFNTGVTEEGNWWTAHVRSANEKHDYASGTLVTAS